MKQFDRYKDIAGGKEYLKALYKPLDELNSDIEELELEKDKLEVQLVNADSHKLADIKKNTEVLNQLDPIKKALQVTKEKKQKYLDEHAKTYLEAEKIIKNYAGEVKKKHDKTNKQIIMKLNEIRSLYKDMESDQVAEMHTVRAFADELDAFIDRELTYEEEHKYGKYADLSTQVTQAIENPWGRGYHGLIFRTLPEHLYGVQGLLKPDMSIEGHKVVGGNVNDWNRAFGVIK